MGLFRKATRTAGRVAQHVAKKAVFGDLEKRKAVQEGRRKGGVAKARERRGMRGIPTPEGEFEPKDDAAMQAEWQKYYDTSARARFYDWCPDDFETRKEVVEKQTEEEPEGAC